MKIELTKEIAIAMVKGSFVGWDKMQHPLALQNGSYVGGFSDKWTWKYGAFEKNTLEEIYEFYQFLQEDI